MDLVRSQVKGFGYLNLFVIREFDVNFTKIAVNNPFAWTVVGSVIKMVSS